MFTITEPESSEDAMMEMLEIKTSLLQQLGLPYRVLEMPTEELGAAAFRKFDIEVWMPSREAYGEVCSISNCTDYQAMRLGIHRHPDKTLLHTINGTALAVPRILLALLEHYQNEDGSVDLPLNFGRIGKLT